MSIKIVECPRDAMQGWACFIPIKLKAQYLNQLLKVGFDTLDFGSFVSPRLIPQMRNTDKVLKRLRLSDTKTELLAIVANERGAREALEFEEICYLGYPFSISETFQRHNTGKGIAESVVTLDRLQNMVVKRGRQLVVYLSMGFGNPYGEHWSIDILAEWAERLIGKGIRIIALSDTIGVSQKEDITTIYQTLIPQYPQIEFGAHLHSEPQHWREKINAAYHAGCRRFDTAIKGLGGCPMARGDMVGNMPTEKVMAYIDEKGIACDMNREAFEQAFELSNQVFSTDLGSLREKPHQAH